MNIYEQDIPINIEDDTLFINEGGALIEAAFGLKLLADEIILWAKENNKSDIKVFLPSGTGTTALYLQKYLPFEVLTCACVGNDEYLEKQFNDLEKTNHPKILKLPKKYHFGKLYKEFYEIHKKLLDQTKIEFDFLYDCKGWIALEEYLKDTNDKSEIIYIHQGGLLGNISMKQRYEHKYD